MVQRHPVGHTAAPVVAGDGEVLMPQRHHRLHLVERHCALGVGGMVTRRSGPQRVPIAAQIGGDDGEVLRQQRGGRTPHEMRLRVAVEQQERRTRAADHGADGAALARQVAGLEAFEHVENRIGGELSGGGRKARDLPDPGA
jgi:hypothetical protein